MVPKGILFALAAVAVGLLVLGTMGTPEANAGSLWGIITKQTPGHYGYMEIWHQRISPPGPPCGSATEWIGDLQWSYNISYLEDGAYLVWAEWRSDVTSEECKSDPEQVDVSGSTEHNVTICP